MAEETRAIEPIAIMDALATDVEVVENLGNGLRRVIFTAPEGTERHITAKVVMTEGDLLLIIRKLSIYATGILTGDGGPIVVTHAPGNG